VGVLACRWLRQRARIPVVLGSVGCKPTIHTIDVRSAKYHAGQSRYPHPGFVFGKNNHAFLPFLTKGSLHSPSIFFVDLLRFGTRYQSLGAEWMICTPLIKQLVKALDHHFAILHASLISKKVQYTDMM